MKYQEYRDASDRLTIGLEGFPSLTYRWAKWKIARKFSLEKTGECVSGASEKFQPYSNASGSVSIEWDNWSGLTVVAIDPDSEQLVTQIGGYLKKKYVD